MKTSDGWEARVLTIAICLVGLFCFTAFFATFARVEIDAISNLFQLLALILLLVSLYCSPKFFIPEMKNIFRREEPAFKWSGRPPFLCLAGLGMSAIGGFIGGLNWVFPGMFVL